MEEANPIRSARKKLEMTQTEFASALGVNLSTVWRWEKGQLPISARTSRAVEQLVTEKSGAAA